MTPVLSDERIAEWRCETCGRKSMRRTHVRYTREVAHDGRPPVRVVIPELAAIACTNPSCSAGPGSGSFIEDDETLEHITEETYRQLGLLRPTQIRQGRESLRLTQQELADLLGLGGNSLSRWENGRVYQARSKDTLLRIVFDVPEATSTCARFGRRPSRVRARSALDEVAHHADIWLDGDAPGAGICFCRYTCQLPMNVVARSTKHRPLPNGSRA